MSKTNWNVDVYHSEVLFKIKHLVISTVTGSFKSFSGEVITDTDHNFENAHIEFTIDVNSIDTGQPARDEHLKNSDFFEVENYPNITFISTGFSKSDTDVFKLAGALTMKGITKQIELQAEYGGTQKDPWGNVKVGFEVTGTIDRKDFNVSFNSMTETGGLALGEKIKITANIQLTKQV